MKLTKEDKEHLQSLIKHPWFRIVEAMEEEARVNLWVTASDLMCSNKPMEDIIKEVEKLKIYHQARQDFLNNIKASSKEIFAPNIPNIG